MNASSRSKPPLVSINIAGLVTSVTCQQQEIIHALERRYEGFTSVESPDFNLEIIISAEKPHPIAPQIHGAFPRAWFQGQIVRLDAPGYEAQLDLASCRGQLQLATQPAIDEVDYCLRVIYALLLFEAGGFLFHGAGIVRGGEAYVFFGHSGSGKTTVARLSIGDQVLNDDLVAIIPEDGGWVVHATPFWNPTQVQPAPNRATLTAFYRLVQDKQVYLEAISEAAAQAEVLTCIPIVTTDPRRNLTILTRLAEILKVAPCYRLHFLPDASFWDVIFDKSET